MKKIVQILSSLFMLLILMYLMYKAGQWAIAKTARFTIVFPLVAVVATLVGNRWLASKQSVESTTHARRAELYVEVVELLTDSLLILRIIMYCYEQRCKAGLKF